MTADQSQSTARSLDDLRAMSAEIAGAETSPWEPRCVMEAFRSARPPELHLTMQGWADLDAMRSPLLLGEFPETIEEIEEAAQVFGLSTEGLKAEECWHLASALRKACARAFALALRMEPPDRPAQPEAPDGFGAWAPLWACLVTQCGVDPDRAMMLRVDRAHVLIAAHRRNQGWHVAGTSYALRDLERRAQAEEEAARG